MRAFTTDVVLINFARSLVLRPLGPARLRGGIQLALRRMRRGR